MRQFIAFLVLTALFVPTIPLVHAEDGDPVEEVLDSPAEITEELSEPEEEAEELPPPLDIPELEELETELEVPGEEPEIKEPEIPEEEIVPEDVFKIEEMQLLAAPEFHKTLKPIGDDEVIVYDFPTGVWGSPNGAFTGGTNLSPHAGATTTDLGGAWDETVGDFSRWNDPARSYTFDRLDVYLTVTGLSNLDPYPLSSGTVQVRIYAANESWGKTSLYATSEEKDATLIAEHIAGDTCSGNGTSDNPFSDECLMTFEFSEAITLEAGQRYIFEIRSENIVSGTLFLSNRYFYPGLYIVGANIATAPFGNDGVQDAPANNTGAVYMRLIGPEPVIEPEIQSVLFLPGFLASRLYTTDGRQLWEPNSINDIRDLALAEDGTSILPVYVGDAIDRIRPGGPLVLQSIYGNFMAWLDSLETKGTIDEWRAYSYDWRYDVFDVIDDGSLREDGSREYLIPLIEELSQNSRLVIIGHSNGGLLAKALMIRLEEAGKTDLVDRIIFVGTPHVGTPQGLIGLLHGHEIARPFWVPQGIARTSAITMPGAYSLIPSEAYYTRVFSPVATFDEGETTEPYLNSFGAEIASALEAFAFLTNDPQTRLTPEELDEGTPYPLSRPLVEEAAQTHALLDVWTPPANVTINEIAGWGNRTTVGARYYTRTKFTCPNGLFSCGFHDYDPVVVGDGDNTVITSSALFMGSGIYFNLHALSNLEADEREDRKHDDLTESPKLHSYLEFLFDIQDSYEDNLFVTEEPTTTTQTTEISVHSPVLLYVTDSEGRQTGIFPYPDSDLFYIREDIPGSSVRFGGEGKYVDVPTDEEYQVSITGIGSGTFAVEIKGSEESSSFFAMANLPVTSDTEATFSLEDDSNIPLLVLDINGDGVPDAHLQFEENQTVIYQESATTEELEETSNSGSAGTRRSSVPPDGISNDETGEMSTLWPNPYLTPAPPFIPLEEQEINKGTLLGEVDTVENSSNISQTASAYSAAVTVFDWLSRVLGAIWTWILSLLELKG